MSPAKSALVGLAVGLTAYGFATGFGGMFSSKNTDTVATIGTEVTQGGTNFGTTVAPSAKHVAPTLAPSLAPVAPTLAPSVTVTPRVSLAPTQTPTSTPSASPSVTVTPRITTPIPTPIITPTPSPTPTPTQTPTPTPTPVTTPTPTGVGAESPRVVINEVAWAGTVKSASDEWIELYNRGSLPVDLSGFGVFEGDTRIILLTGVIAPGAYYLIERTDDTAVSDIAADIAGSFSGSGLSNDGEDLSLRDAGGAALDAVPCAAGWFAGDSALKASMERIDPSIAGSNPSNWATNTGTITTGLDAGGVSIRGTPKFKNSVSP